MRSLHADEISLLAASHQKKGSQRRRALLMLHGFSSSPAVFRNMQPALLAAYDALSCPLLPGHGSNIEHFAGAKAHEWLLAAEAACKTLLHDYEQVDVLGLSLGGLLASHLASRYPLHHAYLLAPALALQIPLALTRSLALVLSHLGFRYLRNQAGNIHIKEHCEISYRKLPLASLAEILSLIQTFQRKSSQCTMDVFLGRYDEVVDSRQVEILFKSEDKAQIHWLNNSAHVLSLDGNVDEILAVILANIERDT